MKNVKIRYCNVFFYAANDVGERDGSHSSCGGGDLKRGVVIIALEPSTNANLARTHVSISLRVATVNNTCIVHDRAGRSSEHHKEAVTHDW